MKDARFFLVVRFWIAPGGDAQVMRWLEGGHMAEVLRQPGFLWTRRLKLAEEEPARFVISKTSIAVIAS